MDSVGAARNALIADLFASLARVWVFKLHLKWEEGLYNKVWSIFNQSQVFLSNKNRLLGG
jgi:hypothetical protein